MWDVLKDDDDNNNVRYKLEQLHHRDPIISVRFILNVTFHHIQSAWENSLTLFHRHTLKTIFKMRKETHFVTNRDTISILAI